jgi:hypothetical protein
VADRKQHPKPDPPKHRKAVKKVIKERERLDRKTQPPKGGKQPPKKPPRK